MFPRATAVAVKLALTGSVARLSVVPPLLNARTAYEFLSTIH